MINIGRPINGISINGNEWLLDSNNKPTEFKDMTAAKAFLRENGFSALSSEEMEDTFTFKTVE